MTLPRDLVGIFCPDAYQIEARSLLDRAAGEVGAAEANRVAREPGVSEVDLAAGEPGTRQLPPSKTAPVKSAKCCCRT